MAQITAADHPCLGCCYGLGIAAAHLGGAVFKARYGEPVGTSTCDLTPDAETGLLACRAEPA